MIDIVYNRDKHKVTVKGHSGSADKGQDLICSAASILAYTLGADIERLCRDKRKCRRPVVKLSDGKAELACSAVHGFENIATLVFDSVCIGFAMLARDNPDYVRYMCI